MRMHILRGLGMAGLVAVGYVLGLTRAGAPHEVEAQQLTTMPSGETVAKIKAASDALFIASADLKAESMYRSATSGVNSYSVLVGGVDAVEDLRTGRGVDPHTYAALYAGLATEEVRPDLGFDAKGRLTYRDRPVQMYSIERLKKLFAKQQKIVDVR